MDQLDSTGVFWSTEEVNRAINEAISIWQALTGEKTITFTQSVTSTTSNIITVANTATSGAALSIYRLENSSGVSLREMSLPELDQGFYGWRTETASTTTQRPEYWAPVGITQLAIYPRVGATATYTIHAYGDTGPLTSDTAYLDIDEGYLQKLISLAQSLLAFKQGVVEGTDNAAALRSMVLEAAKSRNSALLKTAYYKTYMGHDDSAGEPATPQPTAGIRS